MKKLLFWTAVIVGIAAAVAVIMQRRSGSDDDSWQGYLEDSKGLATRMRSTPPMRHQGRGRSHGGHVEGRGREGQARHFLAARYTSSRTMRTTTSAVG